jgi:hypothetical protein
MFCLFRRGVHRDMVRSAAGIRLPQRVFDEAHPSME